MSKARTAKNRTRDTQNGHAQEAMETMNHTAADINSYVETSRRMAAPLVRLNELTARAFERVARYQYEVAGDMLNLGLAQLHAATQAKDMPELLQKQAELANEYFEKTTQRSQDLIRIAGESQADLTQFIDQASTEVASRANRAAQAAAA